MELSYRDNYEDKYAYAFYCHTRFISNYLSKAIRKDRYETHKDYNAIFIEVGSEHDSFIGGPECLFVFVPFYKERYERSIETQGVSYYLELFDIGLRKASMYDDIPWCVFETALRSFKMNGCRNEWIYKKTIFRERNHLLAPGDSLSIYIRICRFYDWGVSWCSADNELSELMDMLRVTYCPDSTSVLDKYQEIPQIDFVKGMSRHTRINNFRYDSTIVCIMPTMF